MSALSIFKPDRKAMPCVANPIFLTSALRTECGAEVTFEVFEIDARALIDLIGTNQLYHLDNQLFCAELKSLQPCESTHPGLSLLRHKSTLRCVFSMRGAHYNA
jgi:hypothetical protein